MALKESVNQLKAVLFYNIKSLLLIRSFCSYSSLRSYACSSLLFWLLNLAFWVWLIALGFACRHTSTSVVLWMKPCSSFLLLFLPNWKRKLLYSVAWQAFLKTAIFFCRFSKPPLLLVSLDGFRAGYMEAYSSLLPVINKLSMSHSLRVWPWLYNNVCHIC